MAVTLRGDPLDLLGFDDCPQSQSSSVLEYVYGVVALNVASAVHNSLIDSYGI